MTEIPDTDVDDDEDETPWDFRTQSDRDKLRRLLDERDPKRRASIFASVEWDAVVTDLLDIIEAPTGEDR